MKRLILFLFAAALCQGVAAQRIEQLHKREDLLITKMTMAQLQTRFDKKQKEQQMKGAQWTMSDALDIFPDSVLYAGEPIDVYHNVDVSVHSTTVMAELYDLNGKRAKRILREEFTPSTEPGSNINLRIVFDNPGRYELVLYDTMEVMEWPELAEKLKIRRILEILPKPAPPEN